MTDPTEQPLYISPGLGNRGGWTHERLALIPTYKQQIVDALRGGAFPSEICQAIDMRTETYRRWRESDKEFDAACADAIEHHLDTIEKEAVRRAVQGVEDVVVSQGRVVMDPASPGKPLKQRRYSDTLIQFILKGRRRDVYGDKVETHQTHAFDLSSARDELARKMGVVALPPPVPASPDEGDE